jgi:endonuclease/exonuclease/phosphatase family metal-dependent hydrolase
MSFLALLLFGWTLVSAQSLRVVTFNCWTGLDYVVRPSMGEYETQESRDQRLAHLVNALRSADADIIALQEVNPVGTMAQVIADSLGYDCVSVRVNAGIKIASLGIPSNWNEGLALLARKQFRIRFADVWEVSDGFGAFGDVLSFHWSERNIVLVSRIALKGREVYVLNTHLTAAVPPGAAADSVIGHLIAACALTTEEADQFRMSAKGLSGLRRQQVRRIREEIDDRLAGVPVILAADFNVPPGSADLEPLVERNEFFDAVSLTPVAGKPTWDPERNANIRFSTDSVDAQGKRLPPLGLLSAWYDREPRRIDFVMASIPFTSADVRSGALLGETAVNGLFASDHYGVSVDLNVPWPADSMVGELPSAIPETEFLPIFSYDTDVGFGLGGKVFVLNPLGMNESFDAVAFNSSKGERWYRLIFSWPDFELRQGRVYPIAIDAIVDYDKYIKNSFFGVGNQSKFADREFYSREPFELNVVASRGWTETSVSQVTVKYRMIRNFDFERSTGLAALAPSLNSGIARMASLTLTHRMDTRNSYINPSRGVVLQAEIEQGFTSAVSNVAFTRTTGFFQGYATLFYPKTVFAVRGIIAAVDGPDLPVQSLLSVGGTNTLRGSPQDRYLDRVGSVMNAEIRFPVLWRLGGVLGLDAGKVWRRAAELDLRSWSSNPVVGLRLYMDTFVVRADLGFGAETTGFYLNFGQLF